MTQPYVVSEDGATRGLGWDMNTSFSSNRGEFFPLGSFGHTGFTGTSLWIDPTSETFVVFMSNRVHPTKAMSSRHVHASQLSPPPRSKMPIERWKEAEAKYNAAVAARFRFVKECNILACHDAKRHRRQAGDACRSSQNGIDVLEKTV